MIALLDIFIEGVPDSSEMHECNTHLTDMESMFFLIHINNVYDLLYPYCRTVVCYGFIVSAAATVL